MAIFKNKSSQEFAKVKAAPSRVDNKTERLDSLSKRETEVCRLLAQGYKLQEVAESLEISYATANTHQTAVYRKLGVNSKSKLIIEYSNYLFERTR